MKILLIDETSEKVKSNMSINKLDSIFYDHEIDVICLYGCENGIMTGDPSLVDNFSIISFNKGELGNELASKKEAKVIIIDLHSLKNEDIRDFATELAKSLYYEKKVFDYVICCIEEIRMGTVASYLENEFVVAPSYLNEKQYDSIYRKQQKSLIFYYYIFSRKLSWFYKLLRKVKSKMH